ncbi:MAG: hypothetical protein J2P22_20530 [Nocardioides sp.]|nr:hypothetical protein [Nocardioides sp.]
MLKKALLVLVVVFLGFWMFTDPHGLANATKSTAHEIWTLSSDTFTALIKFFRSFS